MNILQRIVAERRADLEQAKQRVPYTALRKMAAARTHHSLVARLQSGRGTRVVAEVKQASPSAGLLCASYRPALIARDYEQNGAAGISVLTEPRHFLGSAQHLRDVRAAVALPILRKDFLCDPYQVAEAAAWGADVILIIVGALAAHEVGHLYAEAIDCGLEVLAEAHTAEELDAALALEQAIVGVNSRNLKTLQTDLAIARDLAARIPPDRPAIAESGIHCRADIEMLERCGYRGFLIGEVLMRQSDPGRKLKEMIG